MRDTAGSGPLTDQDIPSVAQLDASVGFEVTPAFGVYATGTNLTQSTALASWRPFGARPIAPFQANLGLRVRP